MKKLVDAIVVVVLTATLTGACKSKSSEDAVRAPASLSFDKVLSVAPAPCERSASAMRVVASDGVQCFELDPDGFTTTRFTAKAAKMTASTVRDFAAVALTRTEESELDVFDALAKACFDRAASCPSAQLAVVYRG